MSVIESVKDPVYTKSRSEMVQEEFTQEEKKKSALDQINVPSKDYSAVKHEFVSEDLYNLFCMLPGDDATKNTILEALRAPPIPK